MVRTKAIRILILAAALAAPVAPRASAGDGALVGEVRAADGTTVRGTIVWNGGKAFRDQRLETVLQEALEIGEREESVEVFGLKLWSWTETDTLRLGVDVPFGLIASAERGRDDAATLTLVGGATLVVEDGRDLRTRVPVEVHTAAGEIRTLRWDEIERVRFLRGASAEGEAGAPIAGRIYGTVASGDRSWTGYVAWDRDETRLDEVLDGDQAEIPFGAIAEIHRVDARRARVVRSDGSEIELSGTNDVNSSNRGIEVEIDGLGRIRLAWNRFDALVLAPAPSAPRVSHAHQPIVGTVVSTDGTRHHGRIVWGDHERWTWESLDGEADRGIDVAVDFAHVRRVTRTAEGAHVEVANGTTWTLREDDVAVDARPIEVRADGDRAVRIPWPDVAEVEFDTPSKAPVADGS